MVQKSIRKSDDEIMLIFSHTMPSHLKASYLWEEHVKPMCQKLEAGIGYGPGPYDVYLSQETEKRWKDGCQALSFVGALASGFPALFSRQ